VIGLLVGLTVLTAALKGAGALLPELPPGLVARLSGLAPALLAALVYVELAGDQAAPQLGAKAAGVAAAVVLAWRRAPFAVCVIAGAAVAAGLRAFTGVQ
jgi:branched-subunit amino acid transport protein